MKVLEAILGVALMHRDRGGIELTREGAVFQQFAEQGLATLSHVLASLDALSAGTATPLRIGALPQVAADLLPDVILRFGELSPDTTVTVEDGRIGDRVDRQRSGELDLVVGRMGRPETMVGLSFKQLYSEQVVFAVAIDHPLANAMAHETDLDALQDNGILYPPKGAAIRPLIDRFLITHGIGDWPNRIETVSSSFGRTMTLGPAAAIRIISTGVMARDIAAERMVTLPIDTSSMAGPVGILVRSEEDPTPTIRLCRQALLEARKVQ